MVGVKVDPTLKKLGWLTPNSIHNEAATSFVKQALSKNNVSEEDKTPTFAEMQSNIEHYNGDLQINDYVYLDFNEKLFDKSFDVSVREFPLNILSLLFSNYFSPKFW